jgi:hypothetical protein
MCKFLYNTNWLKAFMLSILAFCFVCRSFAQDGEKDTVAVGEEGSQYDTSPIQTQSENNFDTNGRNVVRPQLRKVSDTSLDRIRKDEDYWYANLSPKKNKEKPPPKKSESREKSVFNTTWFNTLFWIIVIGGFVAILVWYLASSDIRLFRKPSAAVTDGEDETIIEDIFELNYDKEIAAAIDAQNFRLATRLMYLRTLKELSDRELIQYKNEKTNSDYLFQLSGTKYYRDFFRLTRDFEYTWYGAFALSAEAFAIVQKDFSSFKQQLS